MNKEALISVLAEMTDPANAALRDARAKYSSLPSEIAESLAWTEVNAPLRELMQNTETARLMMREGNGAFSVSMLLEQQLPSRASKHGPEQAADWWERIRQLDRAELLEIVPLWGADILEEIEILDNVTLVPFGALPKSPQREILERPHDFHHRKRPYEWGMPKAALLAKWVVHPIFYEHNESIDFLQVGDPELLDQIRLCLCLIGPCTLVPAIKWYQYVHADLQEATIGASYAYSHAEIVPVQLRSCGSMPGDKIKNVVRAYLGGGDRPRFRRALDRFDRAMRRYDPGDAALELAIALESLLVDGGGELTWKISLRSALMAGGSLSERKQVRAIIQSLYDLRSSVAHTGKTSQTVKVKGYGKVKVDKFIQQAMNVTANVIISAINQGSLPDWFEEELRGSNQND